MDETLLEDLPLATLRRLYDAALRAARRASETEASLYRLGTAGTHAERHEATEERRRKWARVNRVQDALDYVRRQGEAVQVKEDLL